MKKGSSKPLRPIDIRYPERTPLPGVAIFVTLPTLPKLETFWAEHRPRLAFAANGIAMVGGEDFLNEYEWIFAPTVPTLVKAVTRWDEIGIRVEWYNWATLEPEEHALYFADRDQCRRDKVEGGTWSDTDQKEFDQECAMRTPDTYRGWWVLENLPKHCDFDDWFVGFPAGIIDPSLSLETVAERFQIMTFEDWKDSGVTDVDFYDADRLEESLALWRSWRDLGVEYYGQENETTDATS